MEREKLGVVPIGVASVGVASVGVASVGVGVYPDLRHRGRRYRLLVPRRADHAVIPRPRVGEDASGVEGDVQEGAAVKEETVSVASHFRPLARRPVSDGRR